MKKKKLFGIFMASIMAFTSLAGCLAGCSSSGEPKTERKQVAVNNTVKTQSYDMEQIKYQTSLYLPRCCQDGMFLSRHLPIMEPRGIGHGFLPTAYLRVRRRHE